ncbi:MAG: hypothetical protein KC589_07935 [Nanoarchaeota archaeon]|nr:hypothetical protein [Nanoarchaeota archaeon]
MPKQMTIKEYENLQGIDTANQKIGTTVGENNATYPNRPLTSEAVTVLEVGEGKRYATITDALKQVPLYIRHKYYIDIYDGTYDEAVFVPAIISSRLEYNTATETWEGAGSGLTIRGKGASISDVKVKSFLFAEASGVTLSNLEINGQDPWSDENCAVSVYRGNVVIGSVKFTGTVTNAIMAYWGHVMVYTAEFTTEQVHALHAKGESLVTLGDSYAGNKLTGEVSGALIYVGRGSHVYLSNSDCVCTTTVYSLSGGHVTDYQAGVEYLGTSKTSETKFFNHKTSKNLGNVGRSQSYVILLEKYQGSSGNFTQGTFKMTRLYLTTTGTSSSNISDIVEINTFSSNVGNHNGSIEILRNDNSSGNFELVTCDYNSETYLALKFDCGASYKSHQGYIEFEGITESTNTENMLVIPYFNYEGSVVMNSEINSSLASFSPTVTPAKIIGAPQIIPTYADSAAPNSSVYYSSTQSKLVYKDSGGTVNNLY